jgi:hypothetical protein
MLNSNDIWIAVYNLLEVGLNTNYPTLTCSIEDNGDEPKYPLLYIDMVGAPESGMDTENKQVNFLDPTVDLQVYSNTTNLQECMQIINSALNILKENGWSIVMSPKQSNTAKAKRMIARVRKKAGSNSL